MLGTPPAFILSQDQTLMFKCLIYSSFCLANPRFTLLGIRLLIKACFDQLKIFFRCDLHLLFRIFRVVLLFNYQASFKRSRLFLTDSFLRQRDIYYHAFSKLSTLFFKFFYFSANSRFPTVLQKRFPVRKPKLLCVTNDF